MTAQLPLIRDGAWLDAQSFPPVEWVVPSVIPEGLTLLAGAPKIGKSWLTLALALSVATGGKALGGIAVGGPRPVLLGAFEDGDRRLQERCRRLLGQEPIPQRLNYLTRIPESVLQLIGAWADQCGHSAPLCIVDTLGKVAPPTAANESQYQRDYRIASAFKRVVDDRPGMSLIVVTHTRKAAADVFLDRVSGPQGLAGAADSTLILHRGRMDTDGVLSVTGRDVPENEYGLTYDPTLGTWVLAGGDLDTASRTAHTIRAAAGLGDRSADVLALVAAHPAGIRAALVAENLAISSKDAGTYLLRLEKTGRIEKLARGLYTHVGSVGGVGG